MIREGREKKGWNEGMKKGRELYVLRKDATRD